MSGENPFDPFGGSRGERTIIRPNPGGRRSAGPPAAPPPQAPAWTPPAAPPGPAGFQPPQGFAPPQPAPDWTGAAPAPVPPAPAPAAQPMLRRNAVQAPGDNPVLRAAAPLLLLLGRLRVAPMGAPFAQLMEQVAASIDGFDAEMRAAGIGSGPARTAKYVLCATADDIVQNIPSEDRHLWTQHSMLSRFFGERTGGVRFFEELEKAKQDPGANFVLLELFHACLALGFQGMHRTSHGGAGTLQGIQRSLYELIRRIRPKAAELSPRWRGQKIVVQAARFQVPVWAVGAVAGVALFGFYLTLRMLLGSSAEAAAGAIVAVHPTTEVSIQRRVFAPPPPPPPPAPPTRQGDRLRIALAPEIQAQKVSLQDAPGYVVVRIANLALFAPGSATLKDEFKPIAERLAAALEQEPGTIKIVGHTDSAPISNVRFQSNFQLSQERAKAVAATLKGRMTKPERLEVEGKGADVPVAPNDTAEGRARNRRVEILVPRAQ